MISQKKFLISLLLFTITNNGAAFAQSDKVYKFDGKMISKSEVDGLELFKEGVKMLKDNDNQGAVDKLTQARELFPTYAPIHHNLGIAYAKTGQSDQAIEELKKSRNLDSTIEATWMSLAGVYQTQGRLPEAVAAYKEFLKRFPNHSDAKKIASLAAGLEKEAATANASVSQFAVSDNDYLHEVTREGVLKWKHNRMPLRVYMESGTGVQGFQEQYAALLKQSFEDWAKASNGLVSFNFVSSPGEADIKCSWSSDPTKFKNIAEAGETQFVSSKNGILNGSIKLLTVPLMKEVPLTDNRMRTFCLHEVGHALGMAGHTTNPKDTMFFSMSVTDEWHDLTSRDANTLVRLYSLPD